MEHNKPHTCGQKSTHTHHSCAQEYAAHNTSLVCAGKVRTHLTCVRRNTMAHYTSIVRAGTLYIWHVTPHLCAQEHYGTQHPIGMPTNATHTTPHSCAQKRYAHNTSLVCAGILWHTTPHSCAQEHYGTQHLTRVRRNATHTTPHSCA